jgi:ribosomal protein S1
VSLLCRGGKKTKDKYQIGEELELKVIRVDAEHRRIALSERALHPEMEQEAEEPERREPRERERYREEELSDRFTLEDHLREFEEER